VNKLRGISGERSIGHLGTLDPLATGVLPLLLGSATRLAKFYGQADKIYEAQVRFGFATDTYDSEGEATTEPVEVQLDRAGLERAIAGFRGVIQQQPPAFSAKKIAGVPAYKLARRNQPVELAPVEIEIFSLDLVGLTQDEATLRVHCGSGTYIRSLAHDLGQVLGCGAHMSALRRTKSGDFTIDQAHTIPELESLRSDDRFENAIISAANLLPGFPSVVTDDLTAGHIRQGRNFHTSPFRTPSGARYIKALKEDGGLLAIAEAVLPNVYHPVVVLP
jgi:tRNA pseudouridine55 synthase